jgi:hypothetical protein
LSFVTVRQMREQYGRGIFSIGLFRKKEVTSPEPVAEVERLEAEVKRPKEEV